MLNSLQVSLVLCWTEWRGCLGPEALARAVASGDEGPSWTTLLQKRVAIVLSFGVPGEFDRVGRADELGELGVGVDAFERSHRVTNASRMALVDGSVWRAEVFFFAGDSVRLARTSFMPPCSVRSICLELFFGEGSVYLMAQSAAFSALQGLLVAGEHMISSEPA